MKEELKSYKLLLLVFIISGFSNGVFAQDINNEMKNKRSFMDRISVGGGLGFGFGSNSILVDVSPMIGYSVTNNFMVGLGITYKFHKVNDYYCNLVDKTLDDYKSHIYGGSVFTRYFFSGIDIPVIENMYLHGEVEPLIFQSDYTLVPGTSGNFIDAYNNYYVKETDKISITSIFLGGGLRQMISENSFLYIEALWNFNEDLYSPYDNPRIRIGISVGI
jgi:hypothetical protein